MNPQNYNQTEEIYEQMENDEFDGEVKDKQLVPELLKFSTQTSATVCCANTVPLQYITDDTQRGFEIYQAFKFKGAAIAWDFSDVCHIEILLDAIKHLEGFSFLNCRWINNEKIAFQAIQL